MPENDSADRKMNWSGGLFRLWLIGSALWIVAVGALAYVNEVAPFQMDVAREATADAAWQTDQDVCSSGERARGGDPSDCYHGPRATSPIGIGIGAGPNPLWAYVAGAVGPPLGALGIWFVAGWLMAGFRKPPAS